MLSSSHRVSEKMVLKILVPTDGSTGSDNAFEYAVNLAKIYEAELVILNVVRIGTTTSYHGVSIKKKLEDELTEKAKHLIRHRVMRAKKLGVKAEGIIKKGLPDKEIAKLASESNEIIMVVMGAFGKNFLVRQLIGSKTEGVLRTMPELNVPLLVVPNTCRGACDIFTRCDVIIDK